MTGAAATSSGRAGDIIAGKYRIDRVLGSGGMGVVVVAHHLKLDERVALKFLHPEVLKSPEAVSRFLQEARAASKIKNEHVVRVTDVGELENGSPYMVMEYLEGLDLSTMLEQRGALPVQQAIDFVLQACEAVTDAHALGIVHRDLKPANLFCIQRSDGQPFIKVLDFGISKLMSEASHGITKTTDVLGSPMYMSPEQLRASSSVDARSDIWSLGVVLFELLTGSVPFDAEASTELVLKIANDPAPALTKHRADAPQGLDGVLATCLEKEREHRYPNVAQLARALRPFCSRRGAQSVERILGALEFAKTESSSPDVARANGPPVASERGARARTASSWGQTGRGRSGQGGRVALAIGLGVVGLGVAGLAWRARSSTAIVSSASESTSLPSVAPHFAAAAPLASPESSTPTPPSVRSPPDVSSSSGRATAEAPSPTATAAAAPAAARSPSPAKPDCDPPYTVDSLGHHVYKKDCVE